MKIKDCYFQVNDDENHPQFDGLFLITPKELFDAEGWMDDSGDEPVDFPDGFENSDSAFYEYDGFIQDGIDALLKAGAEFKEMYKYK